MVLFFPSGWMDVYIERSVRDCKQHPRKHNTYELPGRTAGVYLQSDTLEFNSKVKSSEVNWYLWYSPSRLVLWLFVRLWFTVWKPTEGASTQKWSTAATTIYHTCKTGKTLENAENASFLMTTDRSSMLHAAPLVTGSDVCGARTQTE